ncbi:hypothetical protein [Maridesulfovibrio sp.]|uniref:hypothetical protein n=1 Tax=Maridesulfovibrio sp. TaxID=2795000 RepID=UPI003BAD014C
MDNATIAGIAQAIVNQTNSVWDWKLIVAVIGALSAAISSVGAVLAIWYNWRKAQLELRSATNQKWANNLIDVFAEFDAKNREMMKRGMGLKYLVRKAVTEGRDETVYLEQHEHETVKAIYEHGLLLNKFRLYFDPTSSEYAQISDALDGYDQSWKNIIVDDEVEKNLPIFDAYTNELCRLIAQIVHREIRFK